MLAPRDDMPVITGAGLVTGMAFGLDANLKGVREGRTGVRAGAEAVALCEQPYLRVDVSRELEAQIKFLNGAGELAVTAADEAWRDAGWMDADVEAERKGLWLSQMDAWDWTCIEMRGGFAQATKQFAEPLTPGPALNKAIARYTKPFFILESLKNNAFSFLANLFQLKGANTSVAGFAGGTARTLDLAARSVRRGTLDRALVVGAGRIGNGMARRDVELQGLREGPRDAAYRPLDSAGVGLTAGEGAAAVAVERYGEAKARGTRIRAVLLANAAVTKAPMEGVASPTAAAVTAAVTEALDEAHLEVGDLAAIVLPAVGLPAADAAMLAGLAEIPAAAGVRVTSYRGATGHMALASELADLVLALDILEQMAVPATVGTTQALSPLVTTTPTTVEGRAVLVITAGLQGEAGAIVIARA